MRPVRKPLTPRTAYRPGRFHSNAAAVLDEGKYRLKEDGDMAHSPAMMQDHDTLAVVTALRQVLARQQRILIVGCPPGTFDERLTRHPFLLFWPSSERSRTDGERTIPAEVGGVLLTNQLSHALSSNVRMQVRERKLLSPGVAMSPGAVKRLLITILTEDTMKNVQTEPPLAKALQLAPRAQPEPTPSAAATLVTLVDETLAGLEQTVAGLQLMREAALEMGAEVEAVRAQGEKLQLLRELLK